MQNTEHFSFSQVIYRKRLLLHNSLCSEVSFIMAVFWVTCMNLHSQQTTTTNHSAWLIKLIPVFLMSQHDLQKTKKKKQKKNPLQCQFSSAVLHCSCITVLQAKVIIIIIITWSCADSSAVETHIWCCSKLEQQHGLLSRLFLLWFKLTPLLSVHSGKPGSGYNRYRYL